MKNVKRAQDLIGNDIYDQEGNRIGRVGNVYVDDSTHQPEWVTVRTGMFGTKESFVPLQGASTSEQGINVEVSRNKIREAPRVDAEHGHLSDAEGQDLYTYYGLTKPGTESPGSNPSDQESAEQQSAPGQSTGSQSGHETSTSGQTTAGAAAGGAAAGGAAAGASGSGGTGSGNRERYGERTASAGRSPSETSTSAKAGRSASGSETSGTSSSPSRTRAESATQEASSTQQKSSTQEDSQTSWSTQPPRETARQGSSLDSAEAMPETMTRYEERLRVGTETVETGRVRLRKYVVTEQTSTTIPLTREEVRIEREPIPEAERRPSSAGSAEMGESERELVLHEERPIVNTEQIPVERIRINAEKVTEERTVHGDVRKEQFDIDDQTGKHRASES